MTVPQFAAFLVWYKTGLEGTGKRSFRKAARITRHSLPTVTAWAEDFEWDKLAAAKDAEIQAELEATFIGSVLEEKKSILKRQRTLIAKFYKKIYDLIDKGYPVYDKDYTEIIGYKPMRINFPDMIHLLEFEANQSGAGAGRVGENLVVLLRNLSPEDRVGFLKGYRRVRESGAFDGPGVGSLGPGADQTRN